MPSCTRSYFMLNDAIRVMCVVLSKLAFLSIARCITIKRTNFLLGYFQNIVCAIKPIVISTYGWNNTNLFWVPIPCVVWYYTQTAHCYSTKAMFWILTIWNQTFTLSKFVNWQINLTIYKRFTLQISINLFPVFCNLFSYNVVSGWKIIRLNTVQALMSIFCASPLRTTYRYNNI